jgi:SAM-dependent methyltransferase
MLNERQKAEVAFWKRDFEKYSPETYAKVRAGNLARIRERWPELDDLEGVGLDLGCGPCSIFEGAHISESRTKPGGMFAIDPLLEEYSKFYRPPGDGIKYNPFHNGENHIYFIDGWMDFIFCINVIDHTEYPTKLLDEMYRILRPHGLLFLQVNFDWILHEPEHVSLWCWEDVQKHTAAFFPVRQMVEYDYDNQRYSYWGKFQKTC